MLFEEGYNYTLLDQTGFDMRHLDALHDNSIIKRYSRIYFEDENKIKFIDFKNINEANNFKGILLVKYEIIEIDARYTYFDSAYEYIKYYCIENMGYFKKWKY